METKEQIKHIRTQHNMTQNEFAASLGISRSALTQLEAGHTKPSFDLLQKLIEQYDVDINVFFNSSVPQKKTLDDVSKIGQKAQKILKFYDDQYGVRYNILLEKRLVKQVAERYPDRKKAEGLLKTSEAYFRLKTIVDYIEMVVMDPLKRYANKVRKERVSDNERIDQLLRPTDSPEAQEHLDQIMDEMNKDLKDIGEVIFKLLDGLNGRLAEKIDLIYFTTSASKFLYSSQEECLRNFENLLKHADGLREVKHYYEQEHQFFWNGTILKKGGNITRYLAGSHKRKALRHKR